jgi:hypothetical protein
MQEGQRWILGGRGDWEIEAKRRFLLCGNGECEMKRYESWKTDKLSNA